MARKARQRISYVLPLANSPGGHRLGINGLAVDSDQSILYSGGRDGLICGWDLNFDLENDPPTNRKPFFSPDDSLATLASKPPSSSVFRSQVQAHTHWVNDIILTHSNSALVSASSDLTVKVWRPHAEDSYIPTTIGLHSDYVKCLASPGTHADWVASGGLDHKIRVWDLNGGGERLRIDVGQDENNAKGSVYALSVRGSIMASGGPESIVRLWDPRSGKRITNFVGHTDNVRAILINQDGDTIMTASSDQTVKVWSMTAGRCMYTCTMHNDSVWSLFSDHPQLSVFYSSDRSGLVAKTDVRGCADMDEGVCLAIAQEHEGVNKVVVAGEFIWTGTSSSSINRWTDVDTKAEFQAFDPPGNHRGSSMVFRSKVPSPPHISTPTVANSVVRKKLPLNCALQLSNTALIPGTRVRDTEAPIFNSTVSMRKLSEAITEQDVAIVVPYHGLPEETIEGQNGLIKHVMLNDRKRVLTLDTAGEVMMWDLLKCIPIQSFGKRHLEDVTPEVNTMESVSNWCAVDTRTGKLACRLEDNYCFDAEMYADELSNEESTAFREDQRINLGKWILRNLFHHLIEEEMKRDNLYRGKLSTHTDLPNGFHRDNAPPLIKLPGSRIQELEGNNMNGDSTITPRPPNGSYYPAMTPGLAIGVATPSVAIANHATQMQNSMPTTTEEHINLEKRTSHQSQTMTSLDRSGDYFSNVPPPQSPSESNARMPSPPGDGNSEVLPQPSADADKEEKTKESSSLFGKKFRMNFPKKLGRSSVDTKPAVVDEKAEESDKSEEKEDKIVEHNFLGTIQKIRYDYEDLLREYPSRPLVTGISPSMPSETPMIRLPPYTAVIIQEDTPDSGGVADLYRGTVGSLGRDADLVEKSAPMWLGDLLLRNQIPFKETAKVSFVLQPFQDLLPSIASIDGNARLNANRMLRAKKILAYVAERIESQPELPDPDALRAEEYLELYCHNQLIPPTMTLATMRAHIWKTGGDVLLYYKSNGRKPSVERHMMREPSAEQLMDIAMPATSG